MAGLDLAKRRELHGAVRMDRRHVGAGDRLFRPAVGARSTSSPTTSASSTTSCACSPSAAAGSRWCPAQTRRAKPCSRYKPDGVFLSNGPGDPEPCDYAIACDPRDRRLPACRPSASASATSCSASRPAASTLKMKFGHHGANHPVLDKDTGQVLITSQNHGFAVDPATLPANGARDARIAVRRQPAGHRAHRQAGVLLPGPSGSEPRTARPRLSVRPVREDDGTQMMACAKTNRKASRAGPDARRRAARPEIVLTRYSEGRARTQRSRRHAQQLYDHA